jgi:FkbM family methyltransferase
MSLKRLLRSITRDLLPYADLEFRTPHGLHLYVPDRGAWSSLGEIFLGRIYDPFLPHLGNVRHWVDLGCNQGFFSFGFWDYLAGRENGAQKTNAFLGDANEHCVTRVREAIARNKLEWHCEKVVIGPPETTVPFKLHKDSLASNIYGRGHGRTSRQATTDITARLASETNLFDLVKIDIEGAEQFLFEHHLNFLKRFRYGLCEWHAPVFSGAKFEASLKQLNWRVVELRSQGVEYDLRGGDSWDSPMGMALWENPAPTY